jgi:SAM-dependent methyltransferase
LDEFDRFSPDYSEILNRNIKITGETAEYFAAYKADYIAQRVLTSQASAILEYGCGVGLLASKLKDYAPTARVDGFDRSEESIRRVGERLRAQGVFTSDVTQLGRAYDIVVFANVLHHIMPAERLGVVSDAAGRLVVGGSLCIFEHNPANPLTRRVVKQCPFDKEAILLSPSEAKRQVAKAGLNDIRLDYVVFFPHLLRCLRRLEPLLAWCPLGGQYVIVARKSE